MEPETSGGYWQFSTSSLGFDPIFPRLRPLKG